MEDTVLKQNKMSWHKWQISDS